MKRSLILAVALGSLGLGGCVAYDPYYGPAYVGPPAVVVAPSYYGQFSYYHGGHRHWR